MNANKIKGQLARLKDDPCFFVEKILGWKPYEYQSKLLRCKSKRIVACYGRQSGKTTVVALKCIWFAYTHPHTTTLIVSRGLRQSMIMFQVIVNFILGSPILRRSVIRYTRTLIVLKNGSNIVALPCSQDGAALRGFTAHLVIIDEAAFVNDTVIVNVLYPMLATTGGTLILLSTPWGRGSFFYRCFNNPKFWTQHVSSEECPLISKDFLMEQRRELGELRYKIEYLAEFVEDETAFFTQDLIRDAVDADYELITDKQILETPAPFKGTYFLGLDLGKRIDYSVVTILEQVKRVVVDEETITVSPAYRVVYMKQFPLRTRISDVEMWVKMLYKKFNRIVNGVVDETGMGASPIEHIKDECRDVEGVWLSAQKKQDVMMYTYTRMEQKRIIVPFSKELISQMNEQNFGYSQVKGRIVTEEKGVMIFWHPEGRHDDQLMSLALAVYATREERAARPLIF